MSDKTRDKLLPCPFCGGEAVLHVEDGIRVICRECCATSKCLVDGYSNGKPNGSAWKAVVKAWNTRNPMERIVERLEDNSFWTEPTYDMDGHSNEDETEVINLQKAIEIVKEEM